MYYSKCIIRRVIFVASIAQHQESQRGCNVTPSASNPYLPNNFPAIGAASVSHHETRELMVPIKNVLYSRGKAPSEAVDMKGGKKYEKIFF